MPLSVRLKYIPSGRSTLLRLSFGYEVETLDVRVMLKAFMFLLQRL